MVATIDSFLQCQKLLSAEFPIVLICMRNINSVLTYALFMNILLLLVCGDVE